MSLDHFTNDIKVHIRQVTIDETDSLLLQSNKSIGLDSVSNEMIKLIIVKAPEPLLNCFNDCLIKGKDFPAFFRTSYLKLIPKKGGHYTMSGWRPITITSAVFKLYSKLLYTRMDKIVDHILQNSQKGF